MRAESKKGGYCGRATKPSLAHKNGQELKARDWPSKEWGRRRRAPPGKISKARIYSERTNGGNGHSIELQASPWRVKGNPINHWTKSLQDRLTFRGYQSGEHLALRQRNATRGKEGKRIGRTERKITACGRQQKQKNR